MLCCLTVLHPISTTHLTVNESHKSLQVHLNKKNAKGSKEKITVLIFDRVHIYHFDCCIIAVNRGIVCDFVFVEFLATFNSWTSKPAPFFLDHDLD